MTTYISFLRVGIKPLQNHFGILISLSFHHFLKLGRKQKRKGRKRYNQTPIPEKTQMDCTKEFLVYQILCTQMFR